MIRKLVTLVIIFNVAHSSCKLIPINKIEAVVFGPETEVITTSDISNPGIDGRIHGLEDRLMESKLYLYAKDNRMTDPDATLKMLKRVQLDNNLSDDGMKDLFKEYGYTYDEGIEQFGRMTAANQVMGFKVGSRLNIPEREIIKYWQENPVMREPNYKLQRAALDLGEADSVKELKQKLIDGTVKVPWSEAFWIDKSDVAPEKEFIFNLKPKQVNVALTPEGFELFRLIDKNDERPLPLEERREEIERILQPVRYRDLFSSFRKELDERMPHITFR